MEELAMMLVWLGFFAAIFFGWYYYLQARNKERMALIEKDADITEIYKKREIRFYFPWLKLGMITMGAGFGLFLSTFLMPILSRENSIPKELIAFSLVFFFGGVGLVVAYFIERPKNR